MICKKYFKQSEEASYLRSDSQSSVEKTITKGGFNSTNNYWSTRTAQQPEQSKANVGKTSSEVDDSVRSTFETIRRSILFVVIRNLV